MKLKQKLIVMITAALLTGLLIGVFIGRQSGETQLPSDTSAEAGFARDMGDHHQQAVDMGYIIRDKSQNQNIRQLAFDIINTQATQRGMMMGWLEQWGIPQTTSRPALAWMRDKSSKSQMGHDMMSVMPTAEEVDKLKAANGQAADILFLQLMIRHHTAGVDMAKGLLERSQREEVRRLAQTIVDGQQAEIQLMHKMLHDRGTHPTDEL